MEKIDKPKQKPTGTRDAVESAIDQSKKDGTWWEFKKSNRITRWPKKQEH